MKRLKVLHMVLDLGPGGVERFVTDLLLNYDKNNFEMVLICLRSKTYYTFEAELENAGVSVFYLNKSKGNYSISILMKIIKIVRDFKPDVIHSHTFMMKYALLPMIIKKVTVRIHTVHVPAPMEINSKIWFKIQDIAYKKFRCIPVAVSNAVRDTVEELHNLKNILVIYNGINLENFKNGCKKDKKYMQLIHIGRFASYKNHELLIDTFNILCKSYTNIKLVLVGQGELLNVIQDKVIKSGIADKVEFIETSDNIPELLSNSDIFVFSSKYEGFGLVIAEAMACELPIVSTKVGGVVEMVKDGINGFLVDGNDTEAFANAVAQILENSKLRKKMSRESSKIASQFDLKNTVNEYEKLYSNLYINMKK